MAKYISILLIAFAVFIGIQSCESDLDITAPYQRVPVIHGLLDVALDTQIIMINRTYLGSGNALEMAAVEDSSLFEEVEAYIRWEDNGQIQDSVLLQEITVSGKDDDGLFFAPTFTAYYATSAALNMGASEDILRNRTYTLSGTGDGERFIAHCKVVALEGDLTKPLVDGTDIDFVNNITSSGTVYNGNYDVRWKLDPNAVKYKVEIIVHYTELRMDNSEVARAVSIPMTTTNIPYTGALTNEYSRSGDFFFVQLMNRIESDPGVRLRRFEYLEYVLHAAGEDFTTFLDLGDPVSAFGQDRPRYSNINGGEGIGIFSTRSSFSRIAQLCPEGVTDFDMIELVTGQYTSDLCFCDGRPGSTYNCNTSQEICQ